MSTVRAKFYVQSVTLTTEGGSVVMTPATAGSKENEAFFKYTPGGSITLSIVNKDAVDQFKPGKPYYVDFTEADLTAETTD